MVVLLGIATIWLVYYVTNSFFNKKAGLIASLLYAIAPIVIIYSRSSWNPNVMPFFSLLTLYTLYKGLEGRKWFLLFSGVLLGITLQLHYIAVFLGAITFFYVIFVELLRKKASAIFSKKLFKIIWPYLWDLLLGLSPFLVFEARHGFQNIRNIIDFILFSGETGTVSNFLSTISFVFTRIFGGLVFNYPGLTMQNNFPKMQLTVWLVFSFIVGILSLIKITIDLLKSRNNSHKFQPIFTNFSLGFLRYAFFRFLQKKYL